MFLVVPMIVAALSYSVAAAEVFAGCFNPSVININAIFPRSYNTATITCPEVCRRLSSPQDTYAYSRISTVQPNTSLCWCTTVQPDAAHLIADSSCPYPNLSAELVRPPPNWGWYKCFDFLAQGPANNFTVQSLPECLTACSTYPNAYFSHLDNSNNMFCACYQRGPPFTTDQCGVGVYYHYYHSFGPSEFVKRRISGFEDGEQGRGLCPSGLSACRIKDGDDYSFELPDHAWYHHEQRHMHKGTM
uniref:WSC domain-containing protein n=1 Tax=Kwoniella bestiolae CBS 10118 TaxID=1296100 RepID=A0A1B9FSU3_9TREE|nr:hypothetical protein I302_08626 [Kwoniella bestiolae CBS 10118]OCF21847.1 hypothetical protein I302_08626 [Kwoniella bestiolae CBS 10118]